MPEGSPRSDGSLHRAFGTVLISSTWGSEMSDIKDPCVLFRDDPDRFRERWQAVRDAATPWAERDAANRRAAAGEEYQLARDLLLDPQLLAKIRTAIADG